MRRLALALAALLPLALAQVPARVAGRATVVDGDTLEVGRVRVRLHAVDAPESSQTCLDARGATYRCGQQSALKLADRLGQRTVSCARRDTDRYGRMIAVCRVGDEDMGRWLVRSGLAVAYREYGRDYVADEDFARARRLGIWGGSFAAPADYRRDPASPPTAGTAPRYVAPAAPAAPSRPAAPAPGVYFRDCTAAREAGYTKILRGQPGYRQALDRDADGIACER